MGRATVKDKRRLFLLLMIFFPLLIYFVSNMFSYWIQIFKNIEDKRELDIEYNNVLAKEDELESEISKLQDPEYVAKYAREKYLFSKDGEIIIKIDDND
jgi:cell division protein DivIC